MTTHEMLLLCSSLQGVRRCIPLSLVLGFGTFSASGRKPPTYGLKHAAACRSAANFSWGPLVLGVYKVICFSSFQNCHRVPQ